MRLSSLAEIILPVIIVFLMGMTLYGATVSETGYGALSSLEEEERVIFAEVTALTEKRQWMENRAALMQSKSLDPDMVDERIRDVLGYVKAGDMVISRKDLTQAVAMILKDGQAERKDAPVLDTPVLDALAHNTTSSSGGSVDTMAALIEASLQ